ncbi:MAG: c-type cytochrome [Chlamydiales bacterium]|nr:c-type cytochrome [Chlamydiales bacterium]
MQRKRYQIVIVAMLVVVLILAGYFIYQEIFPEYKLYQDAYISLEEFRSTYSKEKSPLFKQGVKQVVIPAPSGCNDSVDRCVSCHIAVKLSYFSPTRIVYDINGEMVLDDLGVPVKVSNLDYVWLRLEKDIQSLKEKKDFSRARELEALLTMDVDGHKVDMKKVLAMHPLLGAETKPFELHPIDEYGCCSCHSGNGASLFIKEAHGSVFDGKYVPEKGFKEPPFLEKDPKNDPSFSFVYNAKPEAEFFFQQKPILVGALMQSKCVDCHQSSESVLNHMVDTVNAPLNRKKNQLSSIKKGIVSDRETLAALLKLMISLKINGCGATIKKIQKASEDREITSEEVNHLKAQLHYLKAFHAALDKGGIKDDKHAFYMIRKMHFEIMDILGSSDLAREFEKGSVGKNDLNSYVEEFLKIHQGKITKRSLFGKEYLAKEYVSTIDDYEQISESLSFLASDPKVIKGMSSYVDLMLNNYKRGKELFINQGCYACHRIAGYSNGNLGPDLTSVGLKEPWYIKQSILWPQGKLKSSTMPTFRLDQEDVQDLMSFLLAQKGLPSKAISTVDQQVSLKDWEVGEKFSWESAVSPLDVLDLNYAMTVFATEGCASCHKLQGFEGDISFSNEKKQEQISEWKWFRNLFPEQITGYQLVETIEKYENEIDRRLVKNTKNGTLLETLQQNHPKLIETFYSNFQYAMRAKNDFYSKSTGEKARDALNAWKNRVHNVLIMYIQTYGFGRDVAPALNWSGVYRDNEWLLGHFLNPADYVPRSFMPVMPFDESKFYSLMNMLHILGKKNRDIAREVWEVEGFDPAQAYEIYCSQCHGSSRRGNGPVSEMLYTIPKNLRNTTFLLNLTKERALYSIIHGVKGTPMAPWGEVIPEKQLGDQIPVLNEAQIKLLVDWLYYALPDELLIKASEDMISKWKYEPLDVVKELKHEGGVLRVLPIDKTDIQNNQTPLEHLVKEYFDEEINTAKDRDKYRYFLRKKFYTQENIKKGQQLFVENCASCHGSEATGMGARSSYMTDAKPRMLTNLAWLHSRDDLYLLRAIKFGVPGTSMTPWGDQTSVEQRMQMVIFIRSLSEEKNFRDSLATLLYNAFTTSKILLQSVRAPEYVFLDGAKEKYDKAFANQFVLFKGVQEGTSTPEQAGNAYANELSLRNRFRQLQALDQLLVDLDKEINVESNIYTSLGTSLIDKKLDAVILQAFFDILSVHDALFVVRDDKLICLDDDALEQDLSDKLLFFWRKVTYLEKAYAEKIAEYKALPVSIETSEEIQKIQEDVSTLSDIKLNVVEKSVLAKKSRKKQCDIYAVYIKEEAQVLYDK